MGWPRSIRWRYSLRALFVFITLFMLWGGYHTNRATRERQAIELLRGRGATVGFDRIDRKGLPTSIAQFYNRSTQAIWREPCATNISVVSPLEPEVVRALEALPHLTNLAIASRRVALEEALGLPQDGDTGSKVSTPAKSLDRSLRRKSITHLSLDGWEISDDDCVAVAEHETLTSLSLARSSVSDDGIAILLRLPHLTQLTLFYCEVLGTHSVELPGSRSLTTLRCEGTALSPAFAEFIGRSQNVTSLSLHHRSIDDEFVATFGSHPSLSRVELTGNITKSSATTLAQMPKLQSVGLQSRDFAGDETAETDALAGQLRIMRPDIRVND